MLANTTYEHSFVELASYKGKPFVTGSFETNEVNNNRTEIFDMSTDSWQHKEDWDYPYGQL